MRVNRSQPDRRSRQGAAAVELGLLIPVLVTVILGVVDFGRFASSHIAVTNAARAGASYAAEHAYSNVGNPPAPPTWWTNGVRQSVVSEMDQLKGFDANRLGVTATRTFDGSQPRFRVSVTYPFEMIVPWPLLPNQVLLRQDVVMRGN